MNENTTAGADALDELNELNNKYLLFYVEDQIYGVPLALVLDIIQIQGITYLPEMPPHVKGLVNLRGKVVPVIDVRVKFNLPERPYDERTCIVVLDIRDMHIGLIVDRVLEVFTVSDQRMATPPLTGDVFTRYLSSVTDAGDKVILNIDCDKFFQDDLDFV